MQHFVLTRFNIASPGREAPIRNAPGWLNRRFGLFEQYCLPSMASQSTANFQWLIYFDKGTPFEFRERIESARRAVQFEPIFVDVFRSSEAAKHVSERLAGGSSRVVTTRLDNDDAVSKDFLARVQSEAASLPDETIINFRDGIALCEGRLYSAADESNPFTSLVESSESPRTIWAAPHTELASRFCVVQIVTEPTWLQVVHGENVTNRIKGRRLSDSDVIENFAIAPSVFLKPTGSLATVADQLLLHPLRSLREAAIALAKIILRRR